MHRISPAVVAPALSGSDQWANCGGSAILRSEKNLSLSREPLVVRFRAQLAESEASDRSFGLLVGGVLLAVGLLPMWHGHSIRLWAVISGLLVAGLGLLGPALLRRAKHVWLFTGFLLGTVVNPVVLALLFGVVITPVGVLAR